MGQGEMARLSQCGQGGAGQFFADVLYGWPLILFLTIEVVNKLMLFYSIVAGFNN